MNINNDKKKRIDVALTPNGKKLPGSYTPTEIPLDILTPFSAVLECSATYRIRRTTPETFQLSLPPSLSLSLSLFLPRVSWNEEKEIEDPEKVERVSTRFREKRTRTVSIQGIYRIW